MTLHGFNGLRYVLTDYTSFHPFARRISAALCTVIAAVLLAVGAAALFVPIEKDIVNDALAATAEIYVLRGQEVPAELEAYLAGAVDGEAED